MGKGSQPRPKAKKPAITPPREKPRTGKGNSAGGAKGVISSDRCWTFSLVNPTSAAQNAKIGTRVRGALSGDRIAVMAKGVLGYAPARESREMANAMVRTGESLVGEIVSEVKDSQPTVTLCLS
jgi:hypothetical protein